jgi:hypothetical protein
MSETLKVVVGDQVEAPMTIEVDDPDSDSWLCIDLDGPCAGEGFSPGRLDVMVVEGPRKGRKAVATVGAHEDRTLFFRGERRFL